MFRVFAFSVGLLLVGCQSTPPVVERHTSPGGYTFDYRHMPKSKAVSVQMHWPDSWSRDMGNNSAVPFLGTRMMLEGGAGDYTPTELGEQFADIGSRGYLFAVVDGVVGRMDVRADRLERAVPLVRDVLMQPHFDERWRQRLANDMAQNHDGFLKGPHGRLVSVLFDRVIRDPALRRSALLEDASALKAVSVTDLKAWRAAVLGTAPSVITVAGRLDAEAAGAALDRVLGEKLAPAPLLPAHSDAVSFVPGAVVWRDLNMETSHLTFAGSLPLEPDFDTAANYLVALQLFASGAESPLFKRIRDELGATYGFRWFFGDIGFHNRLFSFSAEVDGAQLDAVRDAVREAWSEYRMTGPTAEALEAAVESRVAGEREMLRESAAGVATGMLRVRLRGRDAAELDGGIETWQNVTLETVKAVLQSDFPGPDDWVELAITPTEGNWSDACEISGLEQLKACAVSE